MSKYDEVLKPFVSLMERELHANSGKGDRPGWLAMSAYDCMLEIYYHAAKLQKAIKDGNGDGIAEYSADVANMAMMVADICGAIHLAAPVVERQEPVALTERIASLEAVLLQVADAFDGGSEHPWIPGFNAKPIYQTVMDTVRDLRSAQSGEPPQ